MANFYQHLGKQLQSTLPADLEMLQKSGNPLDIKILKEESYPTKQIMKPCQISVNQAVVSSTGC